MIAPSILKRQTYRDNCAGRNDQKFDRKKPDSSRKIVVICSPMEQGSFARIHDAGSH